MTSSKIDSKVTQYLEAWNRGDDGAVERLVPLVYDQLKTLAANQMRREQRHHTLQPTALLHETFLRLMSQHNVTWQNRRQFFAIAARAMRQVLVDHARQRNARKRGSQALVISLSEGRVLEAVEAQPAGEEGSSQTVDLEALDRELEALAELDPELARIIELRFFAGFTIEETAHAMLISTATVKRGWATARAWLFDRLRPQP